MVVLHIFSSLHQGGAENQFEQIFTDYSSIDTLHLVVSLKNEHTSLSLRLQKKGLKIYFFDFIGFFSSFLSFIKLLKLIYTLKRRRCLIIHCWMYHANLIGWLLSLFSGVNIIWTIRRTKIPSGFTGLIARLLSFISHLGNFPIISNSFSGKESHERIFYSSRIRVICNGFPTDKKSSFPLFNKNHFKFVHIGRFADIKGQHIFVNSALKLLESLSSSERLNVSFTLIGRDVEHGINHLISDSIFKNNFYFLGEVEEPRELLGDYSCYVLSSLSEGSPNSLVESMLEALPCIASDVGDSFRILDDDFFIYRNNDVYKLYELMDFVFRLPSSKLSFIGQLNRAKAADMFTLDNAKRQYESLYKEVAN